MSGKALYAIEAEYLEIIAAVEEADGEISEQLIDELTINQRDLERKCKGYHVVVTMLNGMNNAVDDEIERLTKIKEARVRGIERLKKNLLQALLLFGEQDKNGVKRLEYDTLALSTRRSKGGVIIDNLEKVETKFCKFSKTIKDLTVEQGTSLEVIVNERLGKEVNMKSTVVPDKKALKKEIEEVNRRNEVRKEAAELIWKAEGNNPEEFKYKGELEEVPGAYIEEDKFSLVIK